MTIRKITNVTTGLVTLADLRMPAAFVRRATMSQNRITAAEVTETSIIKATARTAQPVAGISFIDRYLNNYRDVVTLLDALGITTVKQLVDGTALLDVTALFLQYAPQRNFADAIAAIDDLVSLILLANRSADDQIIIGQELQLFFDKYQFDIIDPLDRQRFDLATFKSHSIDFADQTQFTIARSSQDQTQVDDQLEFGHLRGLFDVAVTNSKLTWLADLDKRHIVSIDSIRTFSITKLSQELAAVGDLHALLLQRPLLDDNTITDLPSLQPEPRKFELITVTDNRLGFFIGKGIRDDQGLTDLFRAFDGLTYTMTYSLRDSFGFNDFFARRFTVVRGVRDGFADAQIIDQRSFKTLARPVRSTALSTQDVTTRIIGRGINDALSSVDIERYVLSTLRTEQIALTDVDRLRITKLRAHNVQLNDVARRRVTIFKRHSFTATDRIAFGGRFVLRDNFSTPDASQDFFVKSRAHNFTLTSRNRYNATKRLAELISPDRPQPPLYAAFVAPVYAGFRLLTDPIISRTKVVISTESIVDTADQTGGRLLFTGFGGERQVTFAPVSSRNYDSGWVYEFTTEFQAGVVNRSNGLERPDEGEDLVLSYKVDDGSFVTACTLWAGANDWATAVGTSLTVTTSVAIKLGSASQSSVTWKISQFNYSNPNFDQYAVRRAFAFNSTSNWFLEPTATAPEFNRQMSLADVVRINDNTDASATPVRQVYLFDKTTLRNFKGLRDQFAALEDLRINQFKVIPRQQNTVTITEEADLLPNFGKRDSLTIQDTRQDFFIIKRLADDAPALDLVGVFDGLIYQNLMSKADAFTLPDFFARSFDAKLIAQVSVPNSFGYTTLVGNYIRNSENLDKSPWEYSSGGVVGDYLSGPYGTLPQTGNVILSTVAQTAFYGITTDRRQHRLEFTHSKLSGTPLQTFSGRVIAFNSQGNSETIANFSYTPNTNLAPTTVFTSVPSINPVALKVEFNTSGIGYPFHAIYSVSLSEINYSTYNRTGFDTGSGVFFRATNSTSPSQVLPVQTSTSSDSVLVGFPLSSATRYNSKQETLAFNFNKDAKQSTSITVSGWGTSITSTASDRDFIVIGDPTTVTSGQSRRSGTTLENVRYTVNKAADFDSGQPARVVAGGNRSLRFQPSESSSETLRFDVTQRDTDTQIIGAGRTAQQVRFSGDLERAAFFLTTIARASTSYTITRKTIEGVPGVQSSVQVTVGPLDNDAVGVFDLFDSIIFVGRGIADFLTIGSGIDQRQTAAERITFLITRRMGEGQSVNGAPDFSEIMQRAFQTVQKPVKQGLNTTTVFGNITVTANDTDRLFIGTNVPARRVSGDAQENVSYFVDKSAKLGAVRTIAGWGTTLAGGTSSGDYVLIGDPSISPAGTQSRRSGATLENVRYQINVDLKTRTSSIYASGRSGLIAFDATGVADFVPLYFYNNEFFGPRGGGRSYGTRAVGGGGHYVGGSQLTDGGSTGLVVIYANDTTPIVFFDAGATSWTVTAGVTSVSLHAYGGGAGGHAESGIPPNTYVGAGGGAFAATSSIAVTSGQTIYVQVGNRGIGTVSVTIFSGGGGSSWVNVVSNAIPTNTSQGVLAAAPPATPLSQRTLGGSATSSIGVIRFSGGDGVSSTTSSLNLGGGGAAGPDGPGGRGTTTRNGGANGGLSGDEGGWNGPLISNRTFNNTAVQILDVDRLSSFTQYQDTVQSRDLNGIFKTVAIAAKAGASYTITRKTIDGVADAQSSVQVTITSPQPDQLGVFDFYVANFGTVRRFPEAVVIGSGLGQRQTTLENVSFLITKFFGNDTAVPIDLVGVFDGLTYASFLLTRDAQVIGSGATSGTRYFGNKENITFNINKNAKLGTVQTIAGWGSTVAGGTSSGDYVVIGDPSLNTNPTTSTQSRRSGATLENFRYTVEKLADNLVPAAVVVGGNRSLRYQQSESSSETLRFDVVNRQFDTQIIGAGRTSQLVRFSGDLERAAFAFNLPAKAGTSYTITRKTIDGVAGAQSSVLVSVAPQQLDQLGVFDFFESALGTARRFADSLVIGSQVITQLLITRQPRDDQLAVDDLFFTYAGRKTDVLTVGLPNTVRVSDSNIEKISFSINKPAKLGVARTVAGWGTSITGTATDRDFVVIGDPTVVTSGQSRRSGATLENFRYTFGYNKNDGATINDVDRRIVGFKRSLVELQQIQDNLDKILRVFRVFLDDTTVNDVVGVARLLPRFFDDTLGDLDPLNNINTLISRGTLRITNYVADIDYFEFDYVGESRIIS